MSLARQSFEQIACVWQEQQLGLVYVPLSVMVNAKSVEECNFQQRETQSFPIWGLAVCSKIYKKSDNKLETGNRYTRTYAQK